MPRTHMASIYAEMSSFEPNRSLLNPKFEGYKLSPLREDDCVSQHKLSNSVTQATVSGREQISFKEIQNRIRHNHLSVGYESGHAAFVDSEGGVILIIIDEDSLHPTFHQIFEIPQEINSRVPSVPGEYPSVHAIDNKHWLVSDGKGTMFVIRIQAPERASSGIGQLLATYRLPMFQDPQHVAVPCRLHEVIALSPKNGSPSDRALALVSMKQVTRSNASEGRVVLFDLIAVQMAIPRQSIEETRLLDVLWKKSGNDLPIYTVYDWQSKHFLLAAASTYQDPDSLKSESYQPKPDEIAPVPRTGEMLDGNPVTRPPPYSWTQTGDSVTVVFALPSSVRKDVINVKISSRHLTLSIDLPSDNTNNRFPLPHYRDQEFWDGVQSSTSYWTWDKEGEEKAGDIGLLSLHLDKQHEGTKWSHVYSSAETGEEVVETIDPSELWHIREAFEKYTAELQDTNKLGLGSGVPSLAAGEMDPEVDTKVGSRFVLSWISEDGKSEPSRRVVESALLSTPIPMMGSNIEERCRLVVKSDIDGLEYSLATTENANPVWSHTKTFPALAFVLASKSDTRFVFHVNSDAVLVFESGGRTGGGNIYVYWDVKGAKWGKQAVLKMTRTGGMLLGVSAMKKRNGAVAVLCLCEHELVVLRQISTE